MKSVENYTAKDFSKIADKAILLNETASEEELYQLLGKNLFKLNTNIAAPLPSAGTLRKTPMRRRSISKLAETDSLGFKSGSYSGLFRLPDSGYHISEEVVSIPLKADSIRKNGKDFFEKFRDTIGKVICTNETIIEFINGKSNYSIKDLLIVIVPLVVTAIGIATLSPVFISIIVGVLALIIKSGFQSFCSIYV